MDRNTFVEKMKASIDDWNAQIAGLQARAEKAQSDARAEYNKQLETLRKQRDEAQARMKEAQDASDKAWQDMQKGYMAAWDSIAKSFQDAMGRFR
ncbi:MAG: Mnd1 family [Rhodobacteraceae bacterium HLUCCA12]|nr:MAG: Mnd1 family [Rhodobacteraceae bacterium HLUCCA12]